MFKNAREPLNTLTHFYGIIFSLISMTIFLIVGFINKTGINLILSSMIFSLSMFFLYTSSTIYHYSNKSDEYINKLRKLDHSMIYVLIVGSYTPFIVKFINNQRGYIFLIILWIISIIGIFCKMFIKNFPRALSTFIYIILGWSILFDINSFLTMDFYCFVLIAIGGICYTVGGLIYAIKKPNIFKRFKFHEIFHVFVLAGSFFHFCAVLIYVI